MTPPYAVSQTTVFRREIMDLMFFFMLRSKNLSVYCLSSSLKTKQNNKKEVMFSLFTLLVFWKTKTKHNFAESCSWICVRVRWEIPFDLFLPLYSLFFRYVLLFISRPFLPPSFFLTSANCLFRWCHPPFRDHSLLLLLQTINISLSFYRDLRYLMYPLGLLLLW